MKGGAGKAPRGSRVNPLGPDAMEYNPYVTLATGAGPVSSHAIESLADYLWVYNLGRRPPVGSYGIVNAQRQPEKERGVGPYLEW
ncbi:hypothetical protein R1flu_023907 [Riccia fluitans]|uniref:Uncharacterized protein n=1 Tax=Riccia fluitans TaxID=41844 RepID=A0ABD1XTC5_9MARC